MRGSTMASCRHEAARSAVTESRSRQAAAWMPNGKRSAILLALLLLLPAAAARAQTPEAAPPAEAAPPPPPPRPAAAAARGATHHDASIGGRGLYDTPDGVGDHAGHAAREVAPDRRGRLGSGRLHLSVRDRPEEPRRLAHGHLLHRAPRRREDPREGGRDPQPERQLARRHGCDRGCDHLVRFHGRVPSVGGPTARSGRPLQRLRALLHDSLELPGLPVGGCEHGRGRSGRRPRGPQHRRRRLG